MRSNDEQSKLIEILSEKPNISFACKKIGVSRMTFYRWMKTYRDFKLKVNKAMEVGRAYWNDTIESVVIKKAHEGDLGAAKFYLVNNHPNYIPKRSIFIQPPSLSAEERRKLEELSKKCRERPLDANEQEERRKILESFIARLGHKDSEELLDMMNVHQKKWDARNKELDRLEKEDVSSID